MSPQPFNADSPEQRQGATVAPSERADRELTEAEECLAEEEALHAEPEVETPEAKKNKLPEIPIAELASVRSREDLDRVLARHKDWMDAVLSPKVEVAHGRANLRGADLRPYDLSGANLSGADLSGANLQGVELVGANLTVANLTNANLACANLRNARMLRARVEGADLRGADLTNAHLVGVDLSKAITRSPEEAAAPAEAAPAAPVVESTDLPETQL